VVAGSLNSARLLPRDVLAPALRAGAAALIVAHNHPSGEVTPSRADRLVTVALRDAGRLLGLPLLDHIILTARSHFSFREVEAWETEGATAAA
jgi:DNA repair protein RadC